MLSFLLTQKATWNEYKESYSWALMHLFHNYSFIVLIYSLFLLIYTNGIVFLFICIKVYLLLSFLILDSLLIFQDAQCLDTDRPLEGGVQVGQRTD